METTKKEEKMLGTEYWKILSLCKIMEELSYQASSEAPNKSELADKTEQLNFLAITIKDLLAGNEADFLAAIDTVESIEREEDFKDFMYLWLYLEDTDKKTMMRHAAIHSKRR